MDPGATADALGDALGGSEMTKKRTTYTLPPGLDPAAFLEVARGLDAIDRAEGEVDPAAAEARTTAEERRDRRDRLINRTKGRR